MMKKFILTIINILTLSSFSIDQDNYLVRWWNGNIPSNYPISDEEKNNENLLRKNKRFT